MSAVPVRVPVAFITGAAGGIGRAVIARLRAHGWRVFATDLAIAAIPCGEADFYSHGLDATNEQAVSQAIALCVREFGGIEHVIHLAGRTGAGPIDAVTTAQWHDLLNINLTSAFLIAREAHAALRASRGTLVLMASTNGLNGGNAISGPAYAVAKAGIINLTRYLAKEWAPEGIRVNCLAPGPIDTPMVARLDAGVRDRLKSLVPLGRIGQADEVANAIDYLLSQHSGFITGTVMNVSGGLMLD